MIWLEGQTFQTFGPRVLLWTDAGGSLIVFAAVAAAFLVLGLGLRGVPASQAFENGARHS